MARTKVLRDARGRPVGEYDDDPRVDERGLLRDGESFRVPMIMRDSANAWRNDMHAHFLAQDSVRGSKALVTDGSSDPLALHRPGWRYSTDASARMTADASKQAAYAEADRRDANAWRGETGTTDPFIDQREGDLCTNRQRRVDAREQAYLDYDREQAERWRSPR